MCIIFSKYITHWIENLKHLCVYYIIFEYIRVYYTLFFVSILLHKLLEKKTHEYFFHTFLLHVKSFIRYVHMGIYIIYISIISV